MALPGPSTKKAHMSHTKAPCQARQHSDQMTCSACDITWDMNDRNPPNCRPTPKRSSCRAAMVDPGNHWRPITPQTPRGVKMWLIRKAAGVATTGAIGTHETFFDHWAPIATFSKS